MPVKAERAIKFECEECGYFQFSEDTLSQQWYEDRMVMADNIDCIKCGHENFVYEEM